MNDGSIRLNLSYFDFLGGLKMTNSRFSELFGGPERKPEAEITQREMDIAASIQSVTEDAVMKMVKHVVDVILVSIKGRIALRQTYQDHRQSIQNW